MVKHISKQELVNFFIRQNQKKHNGGGYYLHNYTKQNYAEKQQCGKKSSN